MRAGRLDRRIDLQRRTVTLSAAGGVEETWTTIAARRAASFSPVSGDERFATPQISARQQTEFQVRWSSAIADLSPLDRIVYPIPADSSPPTAIPDTSIYDISAVHEIGRHEGLRIIAVRRTDT